MVLRKPSKFRLLPLCYSFLRYGALNRLTTDAALPASTDPIEKVAPKINNLCIFEKESLAAKFKAYEK